MRIRQVSEERKEMSLQTTVPKDQLVEGGVYKLYRKGKPDGFGVFLHIGQTGLPIFHPPGEPSFQDVFALVNYETDWVVVFERDGTPDDLGTS